MFVSDSGSMSHMVNSLNNMTNLRELKTVVNTVNKKTMMGLLQGDYKVYQKRDVKLYTVTCTDTAYIPYLIVNNLSVTHALTKILDMKPEK